MLCEAWHVTCWCRATFLIKASSTCWGKPGQNLMKVAQTCRRLLPSWRAYVGRVVLRRCASEIWPDECLYPSDETPSMGLHIVHVSKFHNVNSLCESPLQSWWKGKAKTSPCCRDKTGTWPLYLESETAAVSFSVWCRNDLKTLRAVSLLTIDGEEWKWFGPDLDDIFTIYHER